MTAQGVVGIQTGWTPEDGKKITLASASREYLLLALAGAELALLKSEADGHFTHVGSRTVSNEIACLDISQLETASGETYMLAAVGLWSVYSVLTLSVPDLAVTESLQLDTTYLLRSILATTLASEGEDEGTSAYLFVGLGDGTLVTWQLSGSSEKQSSNRLQVDTSSKKIVALGTRPITMYRIQTGGKTDHSSAPAPAVFVASDRSTIISRTSDKLTYASVNMKVSMSAESRCLVCRMIIPL